MFYHPLNIERHILSEILDKHEYDKFNNQSFFNIFGIIVIEFLPSKTILIY